jgi:hypothetical protein
MSENKACGAYLGVYVAEQVLSKYFEHIQRMPNGNPGYDFLCARGYKIDVKSSCRHHPPKGSFTWAFSIKRNKIPDYFLCLAFDNRESLNPEHIWLVPAEEINGLSNFCVLGNNLRKWARFEKPLGKVLVACEMMKGVA